jgi:hypothetical protein
MQKKAQALSMQIAPTNQDINQLFSAVQDLLQWLRDAHVGNECMRNPIYVVCVSLVRRACARIKIISM